jgi:Icc-related predicted phosphoesterase
MNEPNAVLRLAAVADLHYGRTPPEVLRALLPQMNAQGQVVLLCGDLTDHGQPEEAQELAKLLAATITVPMIAVLGNHDYHSGKEAEVKQILSAVGVRLLNGDSHEIQGVGFAGVKGFGGGFGQHTLEPWGEEGIKRFVYEALQETLHLETGLARLRTAVRIAVLHYSPIQATVEGEPPAIFPFLGSSRLEEPLNRYKVHAVFHGHAHRGAPEGRTAAGIPVYNVSLQLLQRQFPDQPAFRILEVPARSDANMPASTPAQKPVAADVVQRRITVSTA